MIALPRTYMYYHFVSFSKSHIKLNIYHVMIVFMKYSGNVAIMKIMSEKLLTRTFK